MQAKAVGDQNKEIKRENAQLHTENMVMQQKLACGKCRDPEEKKWHLLNENARLKDMKRRAQENLMKVIHDSSLPHSETLDHMESASLNLVPFDHNGSTYQETLLSYADRALNEFMMLAVSAEPMWLPTVNGKMLNKQEYNCCTYPGILGPCPEGFVVEASKQTTKVRGATSDLVSMLTDMVRYTYLQLHAFKKCPTGIVMKFMCLIFTVMLVHDVPWYHRKCKGKQGCLQWKFKFARRANSGGGLHCTSLQIPMSLLRLIGLTNFIELLQMNVDLWVQSPQAPNRSVKFLRYSKEIENSQWAVVDVSMDGIRGTEPDDIQNGYMSCRLRPSGCLLQDRSNGACKVLYYSWDYKKIDHPDGWNRRY